jgi:hypothetical protein
MVYQALFHHRLITTTLHNTISGLLSLLRPNGVLYSRRVTVTILKDATKALRVAVDRAALLSGQPRSASRTDRLAAFFNIGDLGFQFVVAHGADGDVLADHIGGRAGHQKRFG